MCDHSSCVLLDDEGLQIPQHVACRSTQDLLFCLQNTVARQQSLAKWKKENVGQLLILTLNLLQGNIGVNDSQLYEKIKTSKTWRRWPVGAPCRCVKGDLPSAIKRSCPLRGPAPTDGPRWRLSADRKRHHVPDTFSRRQLLSAASPLGLQGVAGMRGEE